MIPDNGKWVESAAQTRRLQLCCINLDSHSVAQIFMRSAHTPLVDLGRQLSGMWIKIYATSPELGSQSSGKSWVGENA